MRRHKRGGGCGGGFSPNGYASQIGVLGIKVGHALIRKRDGNVQASLIEKSAWVDAEDERFRKIDVMV